MMIPNIKTPKTKRKIRTEATIPIIGPALRAECLIITIGVGVVLEPLSMVGSKVVLLSL